MVQLRLEILDFQGVDRWRWRLASSSGEFIADQQVELDRSSSEFRAFQDLAGAVEFHTALDQGPEAEWELLRQIGDWMRDEIWGSLWEPITAATEAGQVVLHVLVPPAADALLFRPLELSFALDRESQATEVSLVYDVAGEKPPPRKQPVGDRLRMLALLSMPTGQSALNIRQEGRDLRRLVQRLTRGTNKAIELRVLQYGVTRGLVEEVIEDGDGWDIIHFSGHGLPAGLILEKEDGAADLILSEEFTDLLRPGRERIKLVVLSSCDSGAATVAATLEMLGLPGSQPMPAEQAGPGGSTLPGIAQNLAAELGCGALAMRFPVADDFAIELLGDVYERLLAQGQTLARALLRSLRKRLADEDGRPQAISMATPALFGTAALDLRLDPPLGSPARFDLSDSLLAYFEPEPEQFVGRVGQLARAGSALAPKSEFRGVLFHGMAGAGKTACALELAYRNQGNRFEAMAWFKAPREGESIRTALADLAIALETQIEGLELAHVMSDEERLKKFLPKLQAFLAERSVLVVIDNLESLLTPEGEWRDPRWQLLMQAFIDHRGLSRLVLTSRIPPRVLTANPRLKVEPINSLSAGESVLLARQLPNLGKLMTPASEIGQPAGRELVRRTLEIVQGNPKLIELAERQARDVGALRSRIEEADELWLEGVNLNAFFTTGAPDKQIEAIDFLRILHHWTDEIVSTLPPDQRLAFQMICCVEPIDRFDKLLGDVWKFLWEQLGREGSPSDPLAAFDGLAREGLLAVEHRGDHRLYILHPAVEEAGRASVSPELRGAVDDQLISLWITLYQNAGRSRQTHTQARAGLRAAPYLLRQREAPLAAQLLTTAVVNDPSATTLASALPQLERAVEMTKGTEHELQTRRALLRVRRGHESGDQAPELKEMLKKARDEEDFVSAGILLNDLYNELYLSGRLKEAKEVAEAKPEVTRLAELGPWSRLSDEGQRLQAMQAMGENSEVLSEAKRLLEEMEDLPEEGDAEEVATPWNVREGVLGVANRAAGFLRENEVALDMNAKILESQEKRGVSPLELAMTRYNNTSPLMGLGRLEEAEEILRSILPTVDKFGTSRILGQVLMTWADLESRRGNIEPAIKLQRRALRVNYVIMEPEWINIGHHNLANFLARLGKSDPALIVAHRVAVAMISFKTESGDLPGDLGSLAGAIENFGRETLPASFEATCAMIEAAEEVPLKDFLGLLPNRLPTDEAAFREVCGLALAALEETPPPSGGQISA